MSRGKKYIILLVALLMMANGVFYNALADHNDHKKKERYQKRHRSHSEHYGKRNLTPVNNPTYRENCGGCHFPYQPELLPSGSWDKILKGFEDHFGEVIEFEPESKKIIAEYLKSNAAEYSSAKLSLKILRSLGNQTSPRITQIPYIQRKHHEIKSDVFKRESIGSLSKCLACHRTADKGIYEDDHVVIPR